MQTVESVMRWELTIKITSQVGASFKFFVSMNPEPIYRKADRTVLESREDRVTWEANSDTRLSYPVDSLALWSEKLVESVCSTSFHVTQICVNPSIGDEALDNTLLSIKEHQLKKLARIDIFSEIKSKTIYLTRNEQLI